MELFVRANGTIGQAHVFLIVLLHNIHYLHACFGSNFIICIYFHQQSFNICVAMANLQPGELQMRRAKATLEILENIAQHPLPPYYALMCPCDIDCKCMPFDEVPRVRLSFCFVSW